MTKKKIIGFTAGAFDLCHAGHMLVFKECKGVCDYLIVALQSNPNTDRPEKNRPIMSLEERKIILEGIKYIDKIIYYDTEKDLYVLLQKIQPDIRILGVDWKGKPFTGHDLPIQNYFNTRDHKYSTSELRRRIYEEEKSKKN